VERNGHIRIKRAKWVSRSRIEPNRVQQEGIGRLAQSNIIEELPLFVEGFAHKQIRDARGRQKEMNIHNIETWPKGTKGKEWGRARARNQTKGTSL
jgi:hypothetical protein